VNRAAAALRLAAWSLIRSQSALSQLPQITIQARCSQSDRGDGRLIYRVMKFGTEYVDKGMAAYESRYRQQQMKWLSKQAAFLSLQLIPAPEVTG
jgi:hypothetical protein